MLLYEVLGYILCVLGIIGCFVPVLPGPWLAYAGLFAPVLGGKPIVMWQVWTGLALCIVVSILDYVVPIIGTKKFNGTKYGIWGCTIGTIVGLFFVPIGIIAGPFLGAVIGELCGGKELSDALRSGFGAFIGFFVGTLVKVIVCFAFIYFLAIG
jgi:uncharacterized protein YqgC (DUF456 family)